MLTIKYAVEEFQWNDEISRQMWTIIEVSDSREEAIAYIESHPSSCPLKIVEIYGEGFDNY